MPENPGFSVVKFQPLVTDDCLSVQGTTPTPTGPVKGSFAVDPTTHSGIGVLHLPMGTTSVLLAIPRFQSSSLDVSVNGVRVLVNSTDDNFAYLPSLRAQQTMNVSVVYHDTPTTAQQCEGGKSCQTTYSPAELPPLSSYPVQMVNRDNQTSGAWNGRYGQDGYVFFSYGKAGHHLAALPSYVASVSIPSYAHPADAVLAQQSPDHRVLALNGSKLGNLGCVMTKIPSACLETFVVDVLLKAPQPYKVDLPRFSHSQTVHDCRLLPNHGQ
jgi:hypothetical protein